MNEKNYNFRILTWEMKHDFNIKKKKNIVNLKQYFSFLLLIQHDNRIIWILNFLNQKKKKRININFKINSEMKKKYAELKRERMFRTIFKNEKSESMIEKQAIECKESKRSHTLHWISLVEHIQSPYISFRWGTTGSVAF